jgi:hypothetical protein
MNNDASGLRKPQFGLAHAKPSLRRAERVKAA